MRFTRPLVLTRARATKCSVLSTCIVSLFFLSSSAQNKDSLYTELRKTKSELKKAKILAALVDAWGVEQLDSANHYLDIQIKLLNHYVQQPKAKKEGSSILAEAMMRKAFVLQSYDKSKESRQILIRAFDIAKKCDNYEIIAGTLNNLAYTYSSEGKLDSAKYYYSISLSVAEESKDSQAIARALTNQASNIIDMGEYTEAEIIILRAIKIYKAIHNTESIFNSYLIAAQMYDGMGNIKLSLDYYYKALAIAEKSKDAQSLSAIYNDIGLYYNYLGDKRKSLTHLKKALYYAKKLKSVRQTELCYYNLAGFYDSQHNNDSVRYYLKKSREILPQLQAPERTCRTMCMEASLLAGEKKYQQAIDTFMKALPVFDEMGDLRGKVRTRIDLAECYMNTGKHNLALKYLKEALEINKGSREVYLERDVRKWLYRVYEMQGNSKEALFNYKLFTQLRDSVINVENVKSLASNQYKYEYDKKQIAASIRFEENEKKRNLILAEKNAQIEKERTQRYTLYGGLGLILLFSVFMVNRFRVTNRQKKIIEEQKLMVEEKQAEVLDSIKYAKRIQDALLKEENHVSTHLPEHFVLFKPKDIVSGDFHWMLEKDDFIYLAAADCTGHGVPGAFLTMLGTSYLNEITAHVDNPLPSEILNQLRNKFIRELSQHGKEGETKDGMDISLLRLNTKTNKIDWAGANNPLWIVRNTTAKVEEIKADKQPIGYHPQPAPFTSHTLQLKKGDSLYMFSDGYQDQFGGEKGKKFKASNLKTLITQFGTQPMHAQREQLNNAFENWKSGFEQVDDVCVIGIRI